MNIGVLPLREAIEKAHRIGLDLVEVTASARPPIVRIADYGKYQYEQNKLRKQWAQEDKEKGKKQEMKNIQIKPGTSGDIITHRAKKIKEWLEHGHKVRVKLYLFGRYRSMEQKFLQKILEEFLSTIECDYVVAEQTKKTSEGLITVLQPKTQ